MNYKVQWMPTAVDQLGLLLADPAIQSAILRSVYRVDALLEYFPDLVGESREGDERVILDPPLTLYYRIDSNAKVVEVLRLLAPHTDRPGSQEDEF